MGFLITDEVKLQNGLNVSNVQCTIRGTYSFNKCPADYPSQYRLHFTFVMFLQGYESQPLWTNNDSVDVLSLENLNPFQAIYDHLKSKFPAGTNFVDN